MFDKSRPVIRAIPVSHTNSVDAEQPSRTIDVCYKCMVFSIQARMFRSVYKTMMEIDSKIAHNRSRRRRFSGRPKFYLIKGSLESEELAFIYQPGAMANERKRCCTDIKAGKIFLLRKLYFGYFKSKAFLVICLTKQGQYALLYNDKTRQEQLAFFNIKDCVIRRCQDSATRVLVEFRNSNTARCIRFETRDESDAESWVGAFSGRQDGGSNPGSPMSRPYYNSSATRTIPPRRRGNKMVHFNSLCDVTVASECGV